MYNTLEHFSGFLTMEKGLRPNSVAAYNSDLRDFIAFLGYENCSSFTIVTRDDILKYLAECKTRGMESDGEGKDRRWTIETVVERLNPEPLNVEPLLVRRSKRLVRRLVAP